MASVSSALWSNLYYLYMSIAVVVGALVIGWLMTSLIRYRARPGRPRPADAPRAGYLPAERGHPMWSYVMAALIALIMFGLAFGTIGAINTLEHPPEGEETLYYDVIGYQFGWKYNYTGPGGVPFQVVTPSETDQFIVPVDTVVVLNITSSDVWHNFAIPEYRIRVDAIPGTVNPLWFRATQTGEIRNVCVQLCGLNHANMHTMMKVVTREEYDAFLEERGARVFSALEANYAKTPARGTVVNATLADDVLTLARDNVTANRPVVLNVTNTGAAAQTITFGSASAQVPAGGFARLYAVAPASGTLEVVAGNARATLEVS